MKAVTALCICALVVLCAIESGAVGYGGMKSLWNYYLSLLGYGHTYDNQLQQCLAKGGTCTDITMCNTTLSIYKGYCGYNKSIVCCFPRELVCARNWGFCTNNSASCQLSGNYFTWFLCNTTHQCCRPHSKKKSKDQGYGHGGGGGGGGGYGHGGGGGGGGYGHGGGGHDDHGGGYGHNDHGGGYGGGGHGGGGHGGGYGNNDHGGGYGHNDHGGGGGYGHGGGGGHSLDEYKHGQHGVGDLYNALGYGGGHGGGQHGGGYHKKKK